MCPSVEGLLGILARRCEAGYAVKVDMETYWICCKNAWYRHVGPDRRGSTHETGGDGGLCVLFLRL